MFSHRLRFHLINNPRLETIQSQTLINRHHPGGLLADEMVLEQQIHLFDCLVGCLGDDEFSPARIDKSVRRAKLAFSGRGATDQKIATQEAPKTINVPNPIFSSITGVANATAKLHSQFTAKIMAMA
jgi:hypothetical protein